MLKEYKREATLYFNNERPDYPPFPENYLSPQAQAILNEYRSRLEVAKSGEQSPPEFPELAIIPHIDNTWHDSAEAIINNWIGQVYQLTNIERNKPFKDSVDPGKPLGL